MSGVNLLPWRDWARARRRRRFGFELAAAGLSGVVLAVGIGVLIDRAAALEAARNNLLNQRIAELEQRIAEATQLRGREARLLSRVQEFEQLRAGRSTVARILDALPRTLADGLHLATIARTGDSLAAGGAAVSLGRVSTLMRNIERTDVFSAPALRHVEERSAQGPYGAGSVDFELEFALAAAHVGTAPATTFGARQ